MARGRRGRRAKRRERGLARDLQASQNLSDRFGLVPELDRVDAGRSDEISALLADRQAEFDQAGNRSDESTAALAQRNDFLAMLEGGLGGLTAEENTGFRERGEQGLDRSFAGGLRALAAGRGTSGVRGAAANAAIGGLGLERGRSQVDLERDLQLENIAVQDSRRLGFGTALSSRDDLLASLESGEFDRRQDTLGSLSDAIGGARTDELGRQEFNIGQGQSEDALRNDILFGLTGIRQGRRNTRRGFNLQEAQLRGANRTNGGGTFGGTPAPVADAGSI